MENNPINHQIAPEKKHWYDRTYWLLFLVPTLLLVLSIIYVGTIYAQTGDIIYKDVTLTGGTTLTLVSSTINAVDLQKSLQGKYSDMVVRSITDIQSGKQTAVTLETKAEPDQLKKDVESVLNITIDEKTSSVEFTGSVLSQSFYSELLRAVVLAFVFMAITIFIIFKVPIPSFAVILSAVTDIVVTLAIADMFGMRISTAGIAAFLMLIGYSVDTDILLTTRVLKRRESGTLLERMKSALKTGLTMNISGIVAMLAAYLIVQAPVLKQVFLIILIGLIIDILSTWLGNTAILKWYCDRHNIK
jgi:preprotein translocase subunit SecF